jgi:hypothetical protein
MSNRNMLQYKSIIEALIFWPCVIRSFQHDKYIEIKMRLLFIAKSALSNETIFGVFNAEKESRFSFR